LRSKVVCLAFPKSQESLASLKTTSKDHLWA
jgi:hypothetical protein